VGSFGSGGNRGGYGLVEGVSDIFFLSSRKIKLGANTRRGGVCVAT
jgi:hypothetical protein